MTSEVVCVRGFFFFLGIDLISLRGNWNRMKDAAHYLGSGGHGT